MTTNRTPATPQSATDKFYADQTPENAIDLAIADHRAFTKEHPMYEFITALQKAKERSIAYPKLVDLAQAIVTAYGKTLLPTHTEKHLLDGAHALLRSLGEAA